MSGGLENRWRGNKKMEAGGRKRLPLFSNQNEAGVVEITEDGGEEKRRDEIRG